MLFQKRKIADNPWNINALFHDFMIGKIIDFETMSIIRYFGSIENIGGMIKITLCENQAYPEQEEGNISYTSEDRSEGFYF